MSFLMDFDSIFATESPSGHGNSRRGFSGARGRGGRSGGRRREFPAAGWAPSTPYTLQTPSWFNKILDSGETKPWNVVSAKRFVTVVLDSKQPLLMLSRLTTSNFGMAVVRDCLSVEPGSCKFMNEVIVPFLSFFVKDKGISAGSHRAFLLCLLRTVRDAPFDLWDSVVRAAIAKQLNDPLVIAWVMLRLIEAQDDDEQDESKSELARLHARLLASSLKEGLDSMTTKLEAEDSPPVIGIDDFCRELEKLLTFSEGGCGGHEEEKSSKGPGGRHSNDKLNFREIQIYPTAGELLCSEDPFLPLTEDVLREKSDVSYMDWLFRLLREDIVASVRDEIKVLLTPKDKLSAAEWKLYRRLEARSVDVSSFAGIQFARSSSPSLPPFGLKMTFVVPQQLQRELKEAARRASKLRGTGTQKGTKAEDLEAAERYKRRLFRDAIRRYWEANPLLLQRESLLAFISAEGQFKWLGVVSQRTDNDLQNDDKPSICVSFPDSDAINDFTSLLYVKQTGLKAYQLSASYFAFAPVLERLQSIHWLPFKEIFLDWPEFPALNSDERPRYQTAAFDRLIQSFQASQDVSQLLKLSKSVVLDEQQKLAVTKALQMPVALIQGPPGTGKSFCGALIAKIVHDFSDETILCICYTNHALDQFLEDLLDAGMPGSEFLRLGGGEKVTDRILPHTMGELQRRERERKKDRDFNRSYAQLKTRIQVCEDELRALVEGRTASELQNSTRYSHFSNYIDGDWLESFQMPMDALDIVGKKGKQLREDYLWRRWVAGSDRGLVSSVDDEDFDDTNGVWAMSLQEREAKITAWRREMMADKVYKPFTRKVRELELWKGMLDDLLSQGTSELLKRKRIIGCTTTGAAKYRRELQAVSAGVIIMEEAGEILEAHVVSSLTPSCKHLIMIGDHQQLRPKVNSYSLQVESGGPYGLNRSLFERLAIADYPHVTLQWQHRMRPEISELIRKLMYPELKDASGTKGRSDLKGASSNIIFVEHNGPEGNYHGLDGSGCSGQHANDALSKVNYEEVRWVAKIVLHLQRQGYDGDKMVVLTPYLAQLHAIRNELSKVFDILVGELDAADLAYQGLSQAAPPPTRRALLSSFLSQQRGRGQWKIRVATVDNFQGEEADIVIASLVRSNEEGKVGFMGQIQRVNVLLSRARDALILVGNRTTFENARSPPGARKMWQSIFGMLEREQAVYGGFPIQCQRHGTRILVTAPDDFSELSPAGGCELLCGLPLDCGRHHCDKACHANVDHSRVRCHQPVKWQCTVGHDVYLPCDSPAGADPNKSCQQCLALQEATQKKLDREAKQAAQQQEAKRLIKAKLEELEQEKKKLLNIQQEEATAVQLAHLEHQLELTKKKLELRTLRSQDNRDDHARDMKRRLQAEIKQLEMSFNSGSSGGVAQEPATLNDAPTQAPLNSDEITEPESGERKSQHTELQEASLVEEEDLHHLVSLSFEQQLDALLLQRNPAFPVPCLPGGATWKDELQAGATTASLPSLLMPGINFTDEEEGGWLKAYQYLDKLRIEKSVDASLQSEDIQLTKQLLCLLCRSQLADFSVQSDVEALLGPQPWNHGVKGNLVLYTFSMAMLVRSLYNEKKKEAYVLILAFLGLARHVSDVPKRWLRLAEDLKERLAQEIKEAAQRARLGLSSSSREEPLEDRIARQWNEEKGRSGAMNDGMEEMLKLSGLGSLKKQFLDIYNAISHAKEQGRTLKKRLNICLCGNPGTGKTTVARCYGTFLFQLGTLSGNCFVETTGARLVHEGVQGLEKLLKQIEGDGGGLLFVDEAYQLSPQSEPNGRRVLDYLLAEIENKIGSLAVAFAGYQKKIEKLLEHNEGLPSRFPYLFVIEDYSDEQLRQIFISSVAAAFEETKAVTFEGGPKGEAVQILMRRVGRGRGRPGFGNARAVKIEVERMFERQATRIKAEKDAGHSPDDFYFSREDLLGPDPVTSLDRCPAWAELKRMVGLKRVKEEIDNFVDLVKTNVELEKRLKPLRTITLSRLFLGSPGTGKTTVAKLYGEILCALGFLSNGEVVVKKPSDFIGSVLGESEKNTLGILNACRGTVLVIDEAYGLFAASSSSSSGGASYGQDPFRAAVIDTLVAEVQNVPGDDQCVLLLGYKEEMERMMAASNPGLQRRFSLESAFHFEDFSIDELVTILNRKSQKRGVQLSFDAQRCAAEVLGKRRRLKNFGNGGEVENLLTTAIMNAQTRQRATPPEQRDDCLLPSDFDPKWRALEEDGGGRGQCLEDYFADLLPCSSLMEQLKGYQLSMDLARQRGRDPLTIIPMNFCFVGPPGTGKTTVARRMGRFFCDLGVLGSEEVVETSGASFIGQYVGHTGPRTIATLEKALGRVLFIDEAYQLDTTRGTGSFAKEAVDELVNQLTKPQFHRRLVVILAGYEADIDSLLRSNEGLRSRFSERVVFQSFSGSQSVQLFMAVLGKEGVEIEDVDDEVLGSLFMELSETSGWGNGRDITTLAQRAIRVHGQELAMHGQLAQVSAGSALRISMRTIVQCLTEERDKRREDDRKQQALEVDSSLQQKRSFLSSQAAPQVADKLGKGMNPATTKKQNQTPTANSKAEEAEGEGECGETQPEPEEPGEEEGSSGSCSVRRDAGVSDDVWEELQRTIAAEDRRESERKELEDRARFAEEEANRLADLAMRRQLQEEEDRVRREAEEEARKAREQAEQLRLEAERKREEQRKEEEVQRKLQKLGVCCMGYRWLRCGSGYRCAGGSHFVSEQELGK